MAYRMASVLVTLNDIEGHSPVAGLFKCNPWNIYAAFYLISTDSVLACSLRDSWASFEVELGSKFVIMLYSHKQFYYTLNIFLPYIEI